MKTSKATTIKKHPKNNNESFFNALWDVKNFWWVDWKFYQRNPVFCTFIPFETAIRCSCNPNTSFSIEFHLTLICFTFIIVSFSCSRNRRFCLLLSVLLLLRFISHRLLCLMRSNKCVVHRIHEKEDVWNFIGWLSLTQYPLIFVGLIHQTIQVTNL